MSGLGPTVSFNGNLVVNHCHQEPTVYGAHKTPTLQLLFVSVKCRFVFDVTVSVSLVSVKLNTVQITEEGDCLLQHPQIV